MNFLPSYQTVSKNEIDCVFLLKECGFSVRQLISI